MNHYDLAEIIPQYSSEQWRDFLTNVDVQQWIRQEISMIQESELKKLVKNISSSRSVGQAQVMNTLSRLAEGKQTKEGPAFIYTYVPLNANERGAPNTVEESEDILDEENNI